MNFAALPVVNSWPSTPGCTWQDVLHRRYPVADKGACCGAPSIRRRRAAGYTSPLPAHLSSMRNSRTDPRFMWCTARAFAWPYFGRLHPHLFLEARVHQHVVLIDDAGRRI